MHARGGPRLAARQFAIDARGCQHHAFGRQLGGQEGLDRVAAAVGELLAPAIRCLAGNGRFIGLLAGTPATVGPAEPLTPREAEVVGLLVQPASDTAKAKPSAPRKPGTHD